MDASTIESIALEAIIVLVIGVVIAIMAIRRDIREINAQDEAMKSNSVEYKLGFYDGFQKSSRCY